MSKSNCNICEGLIWNKNQVVFKTYYQLYDENPLGSERQSSKIYEIGYGFVKIKKAYICHPCHDFIMADYPNFNCTKAYPKYRKPNFGPGSSSVNREYVSSNIVKILEDKDMIIKMAEKFGLTHGFLAREDDLENKICNIVGAQGADVVIDTTGNSRVIEQAYELTHPDGKTILVGVPKKGDNISISSLPLHFNKILTGSHGGGAEPDKDIPRFLRLMTTGQLSFDGLITHELPLGNINDAIEIFRSGTAGRIILNMS